MDDRFFIEWDKDDLDTLAIMKVDIPGAGHADLHPQGIRPHSSACESAKEKLALATVPQSDPATYDMLCRADAIACSRWKVAPR